MPRGSSPSGNLPAQLSNFVGREREVREVRRLLGQTRLLTLTGAGGSGKTRLALQVADGVRRTFHDGAWFVDLTELSAPSLLTVDVQDPDVLAYLVMNALAMSDGASGSATQQLADQLNGRETLLVLDNCEHLIPACAVLVDQLLRGCPRAKILATSREPLTIAGETVFGVPPLPTPARGRRPSTDDLARWAAVELFVTRAQAVEPRFALTGENQEVVAELLRGLDGLPLAIELAAARIRTLTPEQILARMAGRFALLSRGGRTAPPRQQTLRACVDWSFELCSKRERLLWARMSVFAGGFALEAAEGVCVDEDLSTTALLDAVTGLVDKSVLRRDDVPGGQAWYRLLDTLRDHGLQRLAAAGDLATLQRRHLDWYLRLAEQAGSEWVSGGQMYWLKRLDREHSNLRAAVEYCLHEPGEAESALRLLAALPPQWRSSRRLLGEELSWLDQALAKASEPTTARARALLLTAYLAGRSGDLDTMTRRLAEGEQLARRLHDDEALVFAAFLTGAAALLRNDPAAAIESLEHALSLRPAVPQPHFAPAVRLQVLTSMGVAAGLLGDRDRARRCYQEVLEITEPRGEMVNQLAARWGLGLIGWLQEDLEDAEAQLRRGLRLSRTNGREERYVVHTIEILAWIAARRQRHRRAATLLGAADALWAEHDKPITATRWMLADHETCGRHARAALGEAAFADAFRHGQTLSSEEIFVLALEEQRRRTARQSEAAETSASQSSTSQTWTAEASASLTRRQHEVAGLVAQGLSNKDIAARLVVSQRTVDGHVEQILSKLGLASRVQVAAWVIARRSGDDPRQPGES